MTLFPEHPMFRGHNRPLRVECEVYELEVEGKIPEGMNGAFYRCGADPAFPPRDKSDIGINGDGYVSRFRFQDGHVDFNQRYVRTDKFKAERKARRALFGAYRNPFTDDPAAAGIDRTTANTSAIWYDGRLLACKEDGLPHQLEPDTLETLGKFDFGGQLRSPHFTAHPKVDPATGDLVFYGYEIGGLASADAAICIGSPDGRLLREDWFQLPYPALVHDFAITENYFIFPVMPTLSDLERMKEGGDHWRWDPALPTLLGVMPRNGATDDVRYFRGPARWSFHTMNAFEEDGKIHLDTTAATANAFFNDITGTPGNPAKTPFYLTRWTCDLRGNADEFVERRLHDMPSDFYDVDPRHVGRPYRYGFIATKDTTKPVSAMAPGAFNSVGRIDHETGKVDLCYMGDDCLVQEPTFVPDGKKGAEGDGYLVAIVNRLKENRGDLVIADARNLAAGPVAIVRLPLLMRLAFHGTWVPEPALQRARRAA